MYYYYSEFKPVKLRLKIDLVSYPARAEGLVNMIIIIGDGIGKQRPNLIIYTASALVP